MQNKRGQGMSTTTIILLILGLVVLVALIWGFATGFSGFQKILSPTNVDGIVENCALSCSLDGEFDFCFSGKTLKDNDADLEVKTSCYVLSNLDIYKKYKIEKCPTITCGASCTDIKIDDKAGNSKLDAGTYDVSGLVSPPGNCFIE